MNYPDEDYVRFYTRDTITWLALEYEGQAILSLMLHGRFNRSGIFDCGGHEPSHAVTLATRCPPEVAKVGLERLLKTKTWVFNNGQIIWPQYVFAQTCKRTDRARKRESRENLALEAAGQASHAVTRGHTRSQPVTPKQKPKQKPKPKPKQKRGESDPPQDDPAGQETTLPPANPVATDEAPSSPVVTPPLSLQQRAWLWVNDPTTAQFNAQPHPSHWPEVHELNALVRERWGIKGGIPISRQPSRTLGLSDPRVEVPVKRLADGISQQDLLSAIDGSVHDRYLKDNPGQRSVRWILGNAERVQDLMSNIRKADPVTAVRPVRRKPDPAEEALAAQKREHRERARSQASPEELARAEDNAKAITQLASGLFKP